MNNPVNLIGVLAGLLGVLLCAISGISRLAGHYFLAGFSVSTLMIAGIALMVFACFVKLYNKS
jgi:hypothetical protein